MKPAVFLDRDGTLLQFVHYLRDPDDVNLIDGAAEAIAALQAAGYACVVVTNQSAIGRGMLSEAGLVAVHDAMHRQLARHGVALDGVYHCPIAPSVDDPTVIEHPDRKPGPGMLRRAAADLALELRRSWMIGDSISDLLAGHHAGCRGSILVRTGYGAACDIASAPVAHVADDLPAAARWVIEQGDSADDALG